MTQRAWKGLLVVSASFFVCLAHAVAQKPWTFLVYMAAANDLHSDALVDLKKMMRVGSNANVNIIVYLTVQEDDQYKVTKKLYIEKGSMTLIGDSMTRDSGDITALQEALQWACLDYPSDRIAVTLWSQGSGALNRSRMKKNARGICYDYHSENYLTDRDCIQAFSWARDTLRWGNKFDIIAFDTDFSASVEMAYALSSCTDYMVGIENSIEDGYEYAYILHYLAAQSIDSLSCAKLMVHTYNRTETQDEYTAHEKSDYIVSVTDVTLVQPFVDNCNAIARILTSHLKGKKRVPTKTILKKCCNMNNCCCFDEDGIYIDVLQFYKNLLKHADGLKLSISMISRFKELLREGIQLFTNMIKANVASLNYDKAGGLSIYFSRYSIDPSYYGLYWTKQNPYWLDFLEAFLE